METSLKIPADIHALLMDMAKIRQTILVNAPQCLPILAPAIIDAEQRINAIWQS
jgi:hypothetical protein